jgi:hypothetical protein
MNVVLTVVLAHHEHTTSPILDPLNIGDEDDETHSYKYFCTANSTNFKAVKLRDMAQDRQNEWVAAWVGEMVRIAAPGAPIIIENMSPEFCAVQEDWGGVSKNFWATAVETYGWDIKVSSITFGKYTTFTEKSHSKEGDFASDKWRYHVTMIKNE